MNGDLDQSIETAQKKLRRLLKPVKRCAEAVDRINKLVDLRDSERTAVAKIKTTSAKKKRISSRKQQMQTWQKEIDMLHRPFRNTEIEVYGFIRELRNILNALPIDRPPLRDIRTEIERLEIWRPTNRLGMRSAYSDLKIIDGRLAEIVRHLATVENTPGLEKPNSSPAVAPAPGVREVRRLKTASSRAPIRAGLDRSFIHSSDYRSIRVNGKTHVLTHNQATIVQVLHKAHEQGTPSIGQSALLASVKSETSRVKDFFRKSPLWETFIVSDRKGAYRLKLPPSK